MIEEISSERFNYQNYEPNYWDRLDMNFSCGILDIVKKVKEKCVGWCDASRLSFRPREDEIAVLCEDEYGYFWFHLCEIGKETFLSEEDYNRMNGWRLDEITKEKFDRYEKVMELVHYKPPEKWPGCIANRAKLEQDEVWTIIRNYDELKKKYKPTKQEGGAS